MSRNQKDRIARDGQTDEVREALDAKRHAQNAEKAKDAVLIEGMSLDSSNSQVTKVSRHRAFSWRLNSAIADKSLEIEGQARLQLKRQINAENLGISATQKSARTIITLSNMQDHHSSNPRISKMLDRMMDRVADFPLETVEDYWKTVRK